MFNTTYSTKHKGKTDTIEFQEMPRTLGESKDVHGNLWDIWGRYCFSGKYYVHARLLECSKSTSNTIGNVSTIICETFLPYKVKIINKGA